MRTSGRVHGTVVPRQAGLPDSYRPCPSWLECKRGREENRTGAIGNRIGRKIQKKISDHAKPRRNVHEKNSLGKGAGHADLQSENKSRRSVPGAGR